MAKQWAELVLAGVLLSSVACGDDDGGSSNNGDSGKPAGDAAVGARDGGMDAARGAAPDATVTPPDSTVITVDAGDAGVVTFVRSDGCPVDAPLPVNRVRIYVLAGSGAKVAGGVFQGSNESTTGAGFVDLASITNAPAEGQWTELTFSNETTYRWLRYFDSRGRDAQIAEIEFYHGPIKLGVSNYGTVSSGGNDHPYGLAFDGKLDTYYSGITSGGNYIGVDIAGTFIASPVQFTPAAGALTGPSDITLASTTPGAQIRYVTDAVDPTATTGTVYTQPLRIETGTLALRAISTAPCYFPSPVSRARYGIGAAPTVEGQRTYHIGNSLTDTLEEFLPKVADSTGVEHEMARSTIPGAPIGYIWEKRTDTAGKPDEASDITQFVRTYAPIDHMTLQPFSDPDFSTQAPPAVDFFKLALQYSPDLQPWIYAQWTSTAAVGDPGGTFGYLADPFARGAGAWPAPETPVPDTWEDTTDAMLRYHEAFRDYVDERIDGKKVLVCPVGSGLAELKRRMDNGLVPGQADFFKTIFRPSDKNPALPDELHLTSNGAYMTALVAYACFYRQNPADKVTIKPDTLSDEQATYYRQLAWEIASNYPLSGIIGD